MKISIEPSSRDCICIGCKSTVSCGARSCPACGREMVPPGDHHPAAAAGDEAAQFYLGCQYFYGIDLPRDLAESEKWYRRSAEQGRVEAMGNVALLCLMKTPPDSKEAAQWLRKAADRGDARAQHILGGMLLAGHGFAPDSSEAVHLWRLAAAQGYKEAAEALAALELESGAKRRAEEISRKIEELTDAKTEATRMLEESYRNIEGMIDNMPLLPADADGGDEEASCRIEDTNRHVETAKRLVFEIREVRAALEEVQALREAAGRGDSDARKMLDERRASSRQRAQSLLELKPWSEDIAHLIGTPSQRVLGRAILRGVLVLDPTALESWLAEARDWLLEFAGNLAATHEGNGGKIGMPEAPATPYAAPPNPGEAAKWLRGGAEQGDAESQRLLASLYAAGKGVQVDQHEAGRLYRLAAEAGDAEAQLDLGLHLLRTGDGEPAGDTEIETWFRAAAKQGSDLADLMLETLFGDMKKHAPEMRALAVRWIQLKVGRDQPESLIRLAEAHRCGEGVDQDDAEAVRLFREAIELDPKILETSGYLAWSWCSEERDKAVAWFGKHAELGEPWAKGVVDQLLRKPV